MTASPPAIAPEMPLLRIVFALPMGDARRLAMRSAPEVITRRSNHSRPHGIKRATLDNRMESSAKER